jgi:Calcineurin-like phosphoesterase
MTKADLAREYRKKHGMEMATKKLARIMYNENNLLFKDLEAARDALKYIEGKKGIGDAKKVIKTEFYMKEQRPINPYKLPESDETKYEPFVIKGKKKLGIFCDVHAPYHSIPALTTAISYCKSQKINALILNGDFWDFHGLSRFLRDPRKRRFFEEIQIGCELMKSIQKELNCKIYFKLGNHDERYEHFLWQKAGEIIGLEEFELANIIKKRVPNVEVIGDKRIIKLNDLNVIHGHEFGGSVFSPVNIARGLYLKGKVSALQGHNHQVSEHTEPDMNGRIVTTWSVGCLCELHPQYLPINKWAHGFAIVDLDKNGESFNVQNKRIYKGNIL